MPKTRLFTIDFAGDEGVWDFSQRVFGQKLPSDLAIQQNLEHMSDMSNTNSDIIPIRKNWMAKLKNDVKISDLCIPGSHEAATISGAETDRTKGSCGLTPKKMVAISSTQTKDIKTQLNSGIRFLDFRIAWKGKWMIVHPNKFWESVAFSGQTCLETSVTYQPLANLIDKIWTWIQENSEEIVFMKLKEACRGLGAGIPLVGHQAKAEQNLRTMLTGKKILEKKKDLDKMTVKELRGHMVPLTDLGREFYDVKDIFQKNGGSLQPFVKEIMEGQLKKFKEAFQQDGQIQNAIKTLPPINSEPESEILAKAAQENRDMGGDSSHANVGDCFVHQLE